MKLIIQDSISNYFDDMRVYIDNILKGDKDLIFYVCHKIYDPFEEKVEITSDESRNVFVQVVDYLNSFDHINFDVRKEVMGGSEWYLVTNTKNFRTMPISVVRESKLESPKLLCGKILFFILQETI